MPVEWLGSIPPGGRVFLPYGAGEPQTLIEDLVSGAGSLASQIEIVGMFVRNNFPFTDPGLKGKVHSRSLFAGPGVGEAVVQGMASYVPCHLSQVPALLSSRLTPDVALLHLSPPDENGYCGYGLHVENVPEVAALAKVLVGEINLQMPPTVGPGRLHVSSLNQIVWSDRAVLTVSRRPPGRLDRAVAEQVARLIPDNAVLQVGIGGIPDAVLAEMANRRHLRLHTGLFTDAAKELLESGAILEPVVTALAMGTSDLYSFCRRNPRVEFHPASFTHNQEVIRQIPGFVSVNSALEVDLTGQVNSEAIGERLVAGVGGQLDFIRGSLLSPGGRAILALSSTTRDGRASRIVPGLGRHVTVPRSDVQWVVTEYGAANLQGLTLQERAKALIAIAHPDHRSWLAQQWDRHAGIPD